MQVTTFHGEIVVTMSKAEIDKMEGFEGAGDMMIASCGGFASTYYDAGHLDRMEAAGMPVTKKDREFHKAVVGCPAIFVVKEAKDTLTAEETEAILTHELGHIRLGHVEAAATSQATGAICNPLDELAADAFAAAMTSKKAMASALTKLICLISETGALPLEHLLFHADMRARFSALQ